MVTTQTSSLTTGIGWDDISGRYRDLRTGRFVPLQTVSDALEATVTAQERVVGNLASQLKNGGITLAEWRTAMADSIKTTHLASSALANGGWAQMTQADYGRVGQIVREQYRFLDNFAQEIASGKQRFDGTLDRRARMYVDAGRMTYESARRAEDRLRGYDEERNVRHSGDSCEGCIEAESLGWQPVGVISLPGQRDCRTNCKCTLERRRAALQRSPDG